MNAKNSLQEYLVKLKLPVPHYKSSIVGGTHHQPEWRSTVILYDGTHHQGNIGSSKSQADVMAAEVALEYLTLAQADIPLMQSPGSRLPDDVPQSPIAKAMTAKTITAKTMTDKALTAKTMMPKERVAGPPSPKDEKSIIPQSSKAFSLGPGQGSKLPNPKSFSFKTSLLPQALQEGQGMILQTPPALEDDISITAPDPAPILSQKPAADPKKVPPSKRSKFVKAAVKAAATRSAADDSDAISPPKIRNSGWESPEGILTKTRRVPSSLSEPCIKVPSSSQRTALIIDLENLPKLVDDVLIADMDADIYIFVGMHHCLASREYPTRVKKIVSPSTRQDGTDTCIQVYVGYLLANQMYDLYLIGTRDHYGSALVEMITHPGLAWNQREARVVTHISHL